MNWLLKSIIALSVLAAWLTPPSCAPEIKSDTYLQQEAGAIQQRTLPPGSRLVNQRPLTRQGWGASASWEFESNYGPASFGRWVTSKLQPDFQVRETANSRLRFSKDVQGDVEMLSMEMATPSGTLHVAVKLEIYPD